MGKAIAIGLVFALLLIAKMGADMNKDDLTYERSQMVENQLKARGIRNQKVLEIIQKTPITCSNYIIDKSPISKLYRINEECHSSDSKDHAKWNCFYKYIIQKQSLENPENIRGLFRTDYPIFYRV